MGRISNTSEVREFEGFARLCLKISHCSCTKASDFSAKARGSFLFFRNITLVRQVQPRQLELETADPFRTQCENCCFSKKETKNLGGVNLALVRSGRLIIRRRFTINFPICLSNRSSSLIANTHLPSGPVQTNRKRASPGREMQKLF